MKFCVVCVGLGCGHPQLSIKNPVYKKGRFVLFVYLANIFGKCKAQKSLVYFVMPRIRSLSRSAMYPNPFAPMTI